MYYTIGASVSSLHRESTDSLIICTYMYMYNVYIHVYSYIHVHVYMYIFYSAGKYSIKRAAEQTSRGFYVLSAKETRIWRRYMLYVMYLYTLYMYMYNIQCMCAA